MWVNAKATHTLAMSVTIEGGGRVGAKKMEF